MSRSKRGAYLKAVELIFGPGKIDVLYTHWHHLRKALDDLDIAYADRIHRHRSWEAITTLSIVKCGRMGPNKNVWHWVVYDGSNNLLYDPAKDAPVTPNSRMRKPRSHLPIYL